MTVPRVAVVTPRHGDPWDELSVVAGRVAGALACAADVEVLVPSSGATGVERGWDGACRVLRFPAATSGRRGAQAWWEAVLGSGDDGPGTCTCPTGDGRLLPHSVQEQVVLAAGGDSPALYQHLRDSVYDVVVFVGLQSPVAVFGVRSLSDRQRVCVIPGRYEPLLASSIEPVLDRAERILVVTEGERRRFSGRVGPEAAGRVAVLGFLLGVNTVARPEVTESGVAQPSVVIARDWRTPSRFRYKTWVSGLAARLPAGVEIRAVGPGAVALPVGVPHTDARIDAWWWMSRATAVLDPTPHRLVAQEVLEAMFLRVPVLVASNGDASREHAEAGNAGLWFRTDEELVASVERLSDARVARTLGDQGWSYATDRFGETDTYVKRVVETILG